MINRIDLNKPIMYHIEDVTGEDIKGTFYESELKKIKGTKENYIKGVAIERDVGVRVTRVLSWRLDKKSKAKYNKYVLTVVLSDGTTEDVPLGKYIGIEKGGVFRETAVNPVHILSPIGDYLKSVPELKKAVWDKVLG